MLNVVEQNWFHTDTSRLSGEERDKPAWWRVDLGASFDVYQVVITNRNYARGKFCIRLQSSRNSIISMRKICIWTIYTSSQ